MNRKAKNNLSTQIYFMFIKFLQRNIVKLSTYYCKDRVRFLIAFESY